MKIKKNILKGRNIGEKPSEKGRKKPVLKTF